MRSACALCGPARVCGRGICVAVRASPLLHMVAIVIVVQDLPLLAYIIPGACMNRDCLLFAVVASPVNQLTVSFIAPPSAPLRPSAGICSVKTAL